MNKNFKVGDRVMVEQAWEDEAGNYHDDTATVMEILPDGEYKLKWDSPEVDKFLAGSDGYTDENLERL